MKKGTLILLIFVAVFTLASKGQENTHPQIKEYAAIYLKIFFQGDIVYYDEKGASKSPLLIMPDGKSYLIKNNLVKDSIVNFVNSIEIINYMARYGWEVNTSNILPYEGGLANNSKSNLINTNIYLQKITFEREYIKTK
ncbi:MAG: hypothetical protein H6587_06020 [Flavobacteriales bacterium]|nr:hypothetical protein [Flavobacteriales bacterium]MCB9364104.1 hypothetical protein [Flavobacteriales bacterium]